MASNSARRCCAWRKQPERPASRGGTGASPVCFDDDFAPDLNDLAEAKGLSREAVIALMTEATPRYT